MTTAPSVEELDAIRRLEADASLEIHKDEPFAKDILRVCDIARRSLAAQSEEREDGPKPDRVSGVGGGDDLVGMVQVEKTVTPPPDAPASGEGDGEFLNRLGDDATKWADEFCKRFPSVPWDAAMGWFANAIEHSFDVRTGRRECAEHLLNGPPLPSASADVVDNLRNLSYPGQTDSRIQMFLRLHNEGFFDKAAAMLEAQSKEIERLNDDNKYWKNSAERAWLETKERNTELASLRETVERYRSGLEKIADAGPFNSATEIKQFARSLLQGT